MTAIVTGASLGLEQQLPRHCWPPVLERVPDSAANVLFDPRFDFHFYDLDFCRTARQNGLHLGTWPISVTHQSYGSAKNDHWRQRRDA